MSTQQASPRDRLTLAVSERRIVGIIPSVFQDHRFDLCEPLDALLPDPREDLALDKRCRPEGDGDDDVEGVRL